MKKKLTIILGILVLSAGVIVYVAYQSMSNLAGGGGINQEVPDTIVVGQPTTLYLYASLTGSAASQDIDNVYPVARFYYRLSGENEYQSVPGRKVKLPSNYQAAVSKGLNYKAFAFTVPSYPLSTIGVIEYYFELQTPGNPNGAVLRIEEIKKIQIEAFDPLKNIDRPTRVIVE